MKPLAFVTAAAALALSCATPAFAALNATLSFIQPSGSALSNQPIDVFLRLTLAADSDPLITDGSGYPTSGFDPNAYMGPIDLSDPNTRVLLNEFFECSGSFTSVCTSGPPYDFNFNFAQPNFIGPVNFNLQPGQSFDWLFGTFTPTGGNAPSGTYSFFNAGAIVQIYNPGADPNDGGDDQHDSVLIAQTCPGQNQVCAFTREVLAAPAVPEPAAWTMLIAGFGLAGAALRRRRGTLRLLA